MKGICLNWMLSFKNKIYLGIKFAYNYGMEKALFLQIIKSELQSLSVLLSN